MTKAAYQDLIGMGLSAIACFEMTKRSPACCFYLIRLAIEAEKWEKMPLSARKAIAQFMEAYCSIKIRVRDGKIIKYAPRLYSCNFLTGDGLA